MTSSQTVVQAEAQSEPDEMEQSPATLTRHGDFNKLWIGQTISAFGTEITTLALPLTAILLLNATATQVGILSALRELAFLGPMLFFGVLVDRMRRRPLMVSADLGRAAVIGLIPLLAFLDSLTMTVLYIVAFLIGCLSVVFDLAYRSYLPSIVSNEQLLAGNSRLEATESLSMVGGPTIAGALIQAVKAPFALVVDAVTFLASAVSLMLVKKNEPPIEREPDLDGRGWRGVFSDIGSGFKVTIGNPVMRALALTDATFNFFSALMLTLFVLYASREIGLSPGVLGVVFAMFGVGGLLGAMSLSKMVDRLGYGRMLIVSYILAIVPIMAIPFIGGGKVVAAIAFGVIHFVVGFGLIASNIAEMTFRQLAVPQNVLGRVNASFRFIIGGLVPIAAIIAGVLGDYIGLRETLFITSAGIPLSLLWLIFSPIPKLRTSEDVEGASA